MSETLDERVQRTGRMAEMVSRYSWDTTAETARRLIDKAYDSAPSSWRIAGTNRTDAILPRGDTPLLPVPRFGT